MRGFVVVLAALVGFFASPVPADAQSPYVIKQSEKAASVVYSATEGTRTIRERLKYQKRPVGKASFLDYKQKIRDSVTGDVESRSYRLEIARRFSYQSTSMFEPYDPATCTIEPGSEFDYTNGDGVPFCEIVPPHPEDEGFVCGRRIPIVVEVCDEFGNCMNETQQQELFWLAVRPIGDPATTQVAMLYSAYLDHPGHLHLDGRISLKHGKSEEPLSPLLDFNPVYTINGVDYGPYLEVDGVFDPDGLPNANAKNAAWSGDFLLHGYVGMFLW